MIHKFLILLMFLAGHVAHADVTHPYPNDWKPHKVCHENIKLKDGTPHCIEVVELTAESLDGTTGESEKVKPPKGLAVLFVPGLFQNGFIFDLMPENQISLARHLKNKFNIRPFFLHVTGLGNATFYPRSDLDFISSLDIPLAIDFLSLYLGGEKFILAGHSQGAITIQASLAGLSRGSACELLYCFSSDEAQKRQKHLLGLALMTGNVSMTTEGEKHRGVHDLAHWGEPLSWFFWWIMDRVPARLLTQYISPTQNKWWHPLSGKNSVAYWDLWSFLMEFKNVTQESRVAMYNRTFDSSSTAILDQFAKGVTGEGLRNASGELYRDHLKNIEIPTVQWTFDQDGMALPKPTKKDNFDHIQSKEKKFFALPNYGHEDFLLSKDLHSLIDDGFLWLLKFKINK